MRVDKKNLMELRNFLQDNGMNSTLETIQPILNCLRTSKFASDHIYLLIKQCHLVVNQDYKHTDEISLEEIAFFYPMVHFISNHIVLKEIIPLYLEKLINTENIIENLLKEHKEEELQLAIEHFVPLIIFNDYPHSYLQKTYYRKNQTLLKTVKTLKEEVMDGITYIVENSSQLDKWQKELLLALNDEYLSLKAMDHVKYLTVSFGGFWKEKFLIEYNYKLSVQEIIELKRQVLFFNTILEDIYLMNKRLDQKELYHHTDRSLFYKHKNLIPEVVRDYFEIVPSRPIFILHSNTQKSKTLYLQNVGRNYSDWEAYVTYLEHLYWCWKDHVAIYIEIYNKPMLFTYDGEIIIKEYL